MTNEVFTEDVDPGGLINSEQIKYLVCYIINNAEKPLSFDDINYVLRYHAFVNYFEYSDAVGKLLKLGHIALDSDDNFVLSAQGKDAAVIFENDIPKSIKERAMSAIKHYQELEETKKFSRVDINKVEDGYKVTMTIKDIGSDLLSLSLFMPDAEYCDIIKEKFYQSPTKRYLQILEALTKEI